MITRYQFYMGLLFRFASFYTGVALAHLMINPANAADDKTCTLYGLKVAHVVSALTNDPDVAMAAQDRAYAYCIVLDYPPDVTMHDPEPVPSPAAKVEKASVKTETSDWAARCDRAYVSFRKSDNTVIKYSSKRRVVCPLPK
jgi:uncharacterized protein YcnI